MVMAAVLFGHLVASLFLHAAYPRFLWVLIGATLATHAVARGYTASAITPAVAPNPETEARPVALMPALAGALALGALVTTLALWNQLPLHTRTGLAGSQDAAVLTEPRSPGGAAPTPSALATPQSRPTASPAATAPVALAALPAEARDECRYFTTTRHNACGQFLETWERDGGVALFGFPLTEAFEESGQLVQYFEYAKFEWHPEFVGTRYEVLLARLGAEVANPPTGRLAPATGQPNGVECVSFAETGHSICDAFLAYWRDFGGLRVLGFPLTPQFDEEGATVQYFERAKLELRPGGQPERYDILAHRLGEAALHAALAEAEADTTTGATPTPDDEDDED